MGLLAAEPLGALELLVCLAASAVVFMAVEVEKVWLRRQRRLTA